MSKSITYSDAGVSIDAANAAVEKIKRLARGTFNARTLSEIGSFGGMFDGAFPGMSEPVLVASADGVGTKLKIAFMTGVHDTVGRDLVNHCTNDILVQGARPLFFLDYVATGVLSPDVIVSVVDGVSKGCRENGCVLLGGETAEMPGFYSEGEYDVAGFIVGVVDRAKVIDGKAVEPGDVVLVRTGHGRLWMKDNETYARGEPGLGMAAARWLCRRKVVLVGSDTWATEVVPFENKDRPFEVHQLLLVRHGVYNLENLDLEELARDKVYEFCYVCTTNKIRGTAAGFTLRPIAIR